MSLVVFYIPFPNEAEAKKVAKHLLEMRLIACGNIYESRSLYEWKGQLTEEGEYTLIAKTLQELGDVVTAEVEQRHSYDTPAILMLEGKANEAYENWVRNQVKKPD